MPNELTFTEEDFAADKPTLTFDESDFGQTPDPTAPVENVPATWKNLPPLKPDPQASGLLDPFGAKDTELVQALAQTGHRLGDIARSIPADVAAGMRAAWTRKVEPEFTGNIPAALVGRPLPIDAALDEAARDAQERGHFPLAATMGHVSQSLAASAPLIAGGAALPAALQRLLGLGFTLQQLHSVPDAATELGEELGKPKDLQDPGKIARLSSDIASGTVFGAIGAMPEAHALTKRTGAYPAKFPFEGFSPPVERRPRFPFDTQRFPAPQETETLKLPIERTVEDASRKQEAAAIHGDVQPQPIPGAGQVPAEVGGERVQPRADEQAKAGTPAPVAETTPLPVVPEVEQFARQVLDADTPLPKKSQTVKGFAYDAGLKTKTIADLDHLLEASGRMNDAMQEHAQRERESTGEAKLQAQEQYARYASGRIQLPREAIEAATNVGSGSEEMAIRRGEPLGERPLDWRTHPEVEEWLKRHAEELGITLPKELLEPKESVLADTKTADTLEQRGPSGLPKGVPDRGPGFPAELMEAGRQLGAAIRSRATLRPGVLGQFVRRLGALKKEDKIEVGDIGNQMTVSHEIGHNVDAVVFPTANLARSQKSLAQRIPGGDIKTLFSELKRVSELMRGPMIGGAGHVAYRKSATELIADFFALYAHDPERARAMAPEWTSGFETQMAKHPDVMGVVRQLTEGNVRPTPGERAPSVSAPAEMPGKAGVKTSVESPLRERNMAEAAQGLLKGEVRKHNEEKQALRITADKWRKDVPNASERLDVGAFREGVGNIEIPGDTIDAVRARMTPEMEKLEKTFSYKMEEQRQEQNKYLKDTEEGEYLDYLKDYLPHFYANSAKQIDGAVRRFLKDSPHAKQRKLPTLAEARDIGLIPITQDVATLYELAGNINWRVATNRRFLGELDNIKTIDGTPGVMPWSKAPAGWVKTDSPMLQRIYARKTPDGTLLWKGGAAVHPDMWPAVRQMIEQPVSGNFWKAYDTVNALARAGVFAFSGFHDLTLRLAALGSMMQVYNPARGLVRVGERNPLTGKREIIRSTRSLGKELLMDEDAVRDAARSGLQFTFHDSESYQKQALRFVEKAAALYRDTPIIGPIGRGLRDIQAWRNKGLWRNTHDAYKLVAFHDLVAKALKGAPPGTDVNAAKERIAGVMNDFYGGQEWQTKFWLSPEARRMMSRLMLAPDWTISTLRSVPGVNDIASISQREMPRVLGTAESERFAGGSQRAKVWAGELAAIAMSTAALQYAIYHALGDPNKGDKEWLWDNEYKQRTRVDITPIMRRLPWHDPNDPTRYYMNLGKRPEEMVRWINGWDGEMMSKLSPPAREIITQLTGMEGDFRVSWKRDHESFMESVGQRSLHAAKEFLPFVFSGNQFALTAPARKGMSKYKAEQAYESVYEMAASPNFTTRIRAIMRGVPAPKETDALPEMVTQITEAAEANGVPAEQIRQRALSTIRGRHYDLFFKAFQKGDEKAMNTEAEALLRLGATSKGMSESVKRRIALTPQ